MCEICSKLAIKHQNDMLDFIQCSDVSIVEFEQKSIGWQGIS